MGFMYFSRSLSISLALCGSLIVVANGMDACVNSTSLSSVVEESYMNHVDLIRQGIPMEMVKFFYDLALKAVAAPECACVEFQSEIDETCRNSVFTQDNGYLSKQLAEIVAKDLLLPPAERLFCSLERREDLPVLRELQRKGVAEARGVTLSRVRKITQEGWAGSDFPSDETMRYDRDQARMCEEFEEKMNANGLWLPATTLSAYVVGICHQIYLIGGKTEAAAGILRQHVRMSYVAARCKRMDGDRVRVPASYVEGYMTRAHVALKKMGTGPRSAMVAGFPAITDVREMVRSSEHFFPELVRRMASVNSCGKAWWVTWNSTGVRAEDVQDVMGRNASLHAYSEFCGGRGKEGVAGGARNCSAGFRNVSRLVQAEDPRLYCCSSTCVVGGESPVKRAVVNEMCCMCCNEKECNADDLAQVVQAQAYGFDYGRESSVANVW